MTSGRNGNALRDPGAPAGRSGLVDFCWSVVTVSVLCAEGAMEGSSSAGPGSDRLRGQAMELVLEGLALGPQLGGLAVEDDLAVVDEQDPVGDRLDLLEDVGRDEHG